MENSWDQENRNNALDRYYRLKLKNIRKIYKEWIIKLKSKQFYNLYNIYNDKSVRDKLIKKFPTPKKFSSALVIITNEFQKNRERDKK